MPITELNHYFVRSRDIERSRNFYCEALGFEVMPRPNFPFPGYWLGVGGKVQVHMGPDAAPQATGHYFGTSATLGAGQRGGRGPHRFPGHRRRGHGPATREARAADEDAAHRRDFAVPDLRVRPGRTDDRTELPRSRRRAHLGTVFAWREREPRVTRVARGDFVVKLVPLARGGPARRVQDRQDVDRQVDHG